MLVRTFMDALSQGCVCHGVCSGCSRVYGRHGRKIYLEGAPAPHILVDCDAPDFPVSQHTDKRCDYIFVSDESERNPAYAAPIEAASGRKKASIVRRQLQAGADFIGKTTTGHGRFQFRPVFAGRLQGEEMRTLLKTRSRIRFRGKKYAAKIISTGKIAGAFGQ